MSSAQLEQVKDYFHTQTTLIAPRCRDKPIQTPPAR
jgi:hypothetical protein